MFCAGISLKKSVSFSGNPSASHRVNFNLCNSRSDIQHFYAIKALNILPPGQSNLPNEKYVFNELISLLNVARNGSTQNLLIVPTAEFARNFTLLTRINFGHYQWFVLCPIHAANNSYRTFDRFSVH